jgi:heptosyltransferase-2
MDFLPTSESAMIKPILTTCNKSKMIVYGSFKGMGDLLSASPVIASELNAGNKVKLLLFPGSTLTSFVPLIDFGPNSTNLQIVILPVSRSWADFRKFFHQMSQFQPDLVWVSPHAPRPASSWKIPLLLWLTKKIYWPKAKLAGASSEPLSFLFNERVSVDRNLPIAMREQTAYSMLEDRPTSLATARVSFIESIRQGRNEPAKYDLLIHPGANAENRSWPFPHYARVVALIPPQYSIAVVGLQKDIQEMQQVLPKDRNIQFLTGTLEASIVAIAQARVILTMDSGSVHFGHVLGVPGVALVGKSDPANIVPSNGSVLPIYERKHPCQPCGKATCSQPEVYCMTTISPETVARALLHQLKSAKGDSLPKVALLHRMDSTST